MQIETTRFGSLTIDDGSVITFPDGLPGFEKNHQFTFVPHPSASEDKDLPFEWLQSVEDGALAFLTVDPCHVFPQYAPQVPRCELEGLAMEQESLAPRLYTLLTIPPGDPCGITANLLAPLVVNPSARLARQVILPGDEHGLRHRLLPEKFD